MNTASANNFPALNKGFAEYGVRALWSMRVLKTPTPAHALAITKTANARVKIPRLAERIEELCRAHQ